MSEKNFYFAFIDRFRGSHELIKMRLCVYLPFLEPFLEIYENCKAVDLGCGRGEWLELLKESGFDAQGFDLNEKMVAKCRERYLKVQYGDAIALLKGLPEASQVVVSGFHFVEHIPFADLHILVDEALRVLMPGGLLILETVNPENIIVGTTTFYLDPTHHRPIPPMLLAFLPEYYGFQRVKILRLQESPEKIIIENIGLIDIFAESSPDYAIVAQKDAAPEVLQSFDSAFAKPYGIELRELANRYDAKTKNIITSLEQRLVNAESQAGGMTAALATISKLQDRLIEASVQTVRSETSSQLKYQELQSSYNSIINSFSWRITLPLRWIVKTINNIFQ